MAKIKRTNMPVSGKLGEYVYTDGKHGRTVRAAPKPGLKKEEPALKQQYSRTKFLNSLASEINKIIEQYNKRFKDAQFYQRLLSRFRKEPEDNRMLLLLQLKGMEINPGYRLEKMLYNDFTIKQAKTTVELIINTRRHPEEGKYHADCYDYELLLLSWDKTKEPAIVERQLSPWISRVDGLPEISFTFKKRKSMTHWLLILRVRLGVKEQYVEAFVAEGMRIIEVGSFDKKEMALIKFKQEEKTAKAMTRPKDGLVKEVRVGVVRIK